MKEESRSGSGNLVVGLLLILLGGAFLADQYLDLNLGRFGWPFYIILPGVAIYLASLALPEEPGKGLGAAGSIITMVGLILFYQNTFNHFESWAYAWVLVAPTSLGLGWIGHGLVRRNKLLLQLGLRLATTGVVIFLVAAIFFELVIGIGGFRRQWADNVWPALLILVGLFLLVRSYWYGRQNKVS